MAIAHLRGSLALTVAQLTTGSYHGCQADKLRSFLREDEGMLLRLVIGVACVFLGTGAILAEDQPTPSAPAKEDEPPPARVLIVAEINQKARQVIFINTAWKTLTSKTEDGHTVTEHVPISVFLAFSLKDGKAMTANGKPLKGSDLWNKIELGKPVVVLSPSAEENEAIRSLFKDGTVILVGQTKTLRGR
jgi:hypothetical protein